MAKFTQIGTGAISFPKNGGIGLILKIDDNLLPLIKKGSGVWLRSTDKNSMKLKVEAILEEVTDSTELGRVDPVKLYDIGLIEKLLLQASTMKSEIDSAKLNDESKIQAYLIFVLASLTDSLNYLVRNKNLSVFNAWLLNHPAIHEEIKIFFSSYLNGVGKEIGGMAFQRTKMNGN